MSCKFDTVTCTLNFADRPAVPSEEMVSGHVEADSFRRITFGGITVLPDPHSQPSSPGRPPDRLSATPTTPTKSSIISPAMHIGGVPARGAPRVDAAEIIRRARMQMLGLTARPPSR